MYRLIWMQQNAAILVAVGDVSAAALVKLAEGAHCH